MFGFGPSLTGQTAALIRSSRRSGTGAGCAAFRWHGRTRLIGMGGRVLSRGDESFSALQVVPVRGEKKTGPPLRRDVRRARRVRRPRLAIRFLDQSIAGRYGATVSLRCDAEG